MFRVVGTATYLEELSRWPKTDREIAEKFPLKLVENPHAGKLLHYPCLREKRVSGRRIYYLVYDDLELVLLVATSGKKDQQETIEHIKTNLNEFRKVAEGIVRQGA